MKYFHGITRNVFFLGLASLFHDMSSEMLYPIIPLFLRSVLGVDLAAIGWLEGIAEGMSTGLRWVGGVLSDMARRRKPFVLWGYALSAISKPVMGLSALVGGWPLFLGGRASDRIGKSIRNAPRDALIAEATDEAHRGFAFGFHRAMDTCGAIAGPLIALLVLLFFPQVKLQYIFFIAIVPGILTFCVAALFVRDIPHEVSFAAAKAKTRFLQTYSPAFWRLILAQAVFSLGNSSDSFLVLRSVDLAFGPAKGSPALSLRDHAIYACCLFAAFNVFFALLAAPAGKLSDRIGRKSLIIAGWLTYAAVYAGFALLHASWSPWLLFMAYGIYLALTDGVSSAMVTDLVPKDQKAGAIGLFYTVSGIAQLAGSVALGWAWQHFAGSCVTWAFLLGTLFALLAVPIIATVTTPRRTTS